VSNIRVASPIRTTRVAKSLADIDGNWSIVARQVFSGCSLTWEWTIHADVAAFRMALAKGLIVQVTGSDGADRLLYAKTAKYIPELRKSDRKRLRNTIADITRVA
jgi:hypothetical protein